MRIAVLHSNPDYLLGPRLPLLRHLSERFDVVAMEPAAFEAWVSETRTAGGTLDAVAYTQLVRPSSAVPPVTFGAVAPKLFETAIHLTMR